MEITGQRGQHMLVLFLLIFGVTRFSLAGYRDGSARLNVWRHPLLRRLHLTETLQLVNA
jgi:hypothetical protein